MRSILIHGILRRMEELGFTPKRLSLSAGLNETYVRDLVERNVNPRSRSLAKLAAALNCTAAELLVPALRGKEAGMMKRAVALADRILADEAVSDREASHTRIALAIYDVLGERADAGRPISESDEDTIALIESLMKRMAREA